MYKKILLYIGGAILFIIVLTSFVSNNISNPVSENIVKQDEVIAVASTTEENILKSKAVVTKDNLYSVIKVVDGDTVDVSMGGVTERIRLIGINTPETVDPRKPVECFGVEASNKAKALLTGKKVSLESDSTQGELDKYNRLLRYVFLEDGATFNILMIKEGYA